MDAAQQTVDEVAERLFGSLLGTVEIMSVYLGDRLGWYRSLTREGPASAVELARRTDTQVRYAREWLEQQAVAGLLAVESDGPPDDRRFVIPAGTAEVMTDPTSLAYLAPLGRMFGAVGPVPATPRGIPTRRRCQRDDLGDDARESQADANRPWYEKSSTRTRRGAGRPRRPGRSGLPDARRGLRRGLVEHRPGSGLPRGNRARRRHRSALGRLGRGERPRRRCGRASALRVPGRRLPSYGDGRRGVRLRVRARHAPTSRGPRRGPADTRSRRLPHRDGRSRGRRLRARRQRPGADHVRIQPLRLPAGRAFLPLERGDRNGDAPVNTAGLRRGRRLRGSSRSSRSRTSDSGASTGCPDPMSSTG